MLVRPKSLVLLILDGFEYPLGRDCNAIAAAKKPCGGKLQQDCPMTAAHGNIEQMREGGSLSDPAPTMLDILGIPQTVEMTGRSLPAAH